MLRCTRPRVCQWGVAHIETAASKFSVLLAHFENERWPTASQDKKNAEIVRELEYSFRKWCKLMVLRGMEEEMVLREMEEERVEVVLLPLYIMGHLISTVELAKLLVKHNPFSATILLMHLSIPETDLYIQTVKSSGLNIRFVHLPPTDYPSFNENEGVETFISLYINSYKTLVKDAIAKIAASPSTRVVAFIFDLFSTDMIDVAAELGIPAYVYFTSNAALLGLMLLLPTLHDKIPCEFEEFQGEIEIPGLLPLPSAVMPTPLMDKKKDAYTWFVCHSRRFREAQGIIVNTFAELEPTALQAIVDGQCLPDHETPPIYPVGPLIALAEKPHEKAGLFIDWLDQQPTSSVVFLCFGSMGALSSPQLKEIAIGLEKSGHRFLWSVRQRPPGKLRIPVDANLDEVLPEGFLERTKGKGIVWPSSVPQVAILQHPAIGGFVSHCGWNSILESLWFGVPILAWPLYAEQKLNAFQLVKDYGLALRLRLDYSADSLVTAEELERGVRCLMGDSEEGMQVRKKVKEMAEASRKAASDGGSSVASLGRLTEILLEAST